MSVNTHKISSHEYFSSFLSYAHDCMEITDVAGLLYMLEKPWKWEDEFNEFLARIEKHGGDASNFGSEADEKAGVWSFKTEVDEVGDPSKAELDAAKAEKDAEDEQFPEGDPHPSAGISMGAPR